MSPKQPQQQEQTEEANPEHMQGEPQSKDAEGINLQAEQESLAALAAAMSQATMQEQQSASTEARIAELEQEAASWRDKAMRAVADAENTRRRAEREQQEQAKYAITNFARDLVSVFENLTRASASISEEARRADEQVNNLAMGVEMTLREMESVFAKFKITRIDPTGEPFDHNYHQAMTKMETSDYPAGTVMHVMQAAYTIHDRLLQPAMVVVATEPKQSPDSNGQPQHVDKQV